jgi:hypothetical protein
MNNLFSRNLVIKSDLMNGLSFNDINKDLNQHEFTKLKDDEYKQFLTWYNQVEHNSEDNYFSEYKPSH